MIRKLFVILLCSVMIFELTGCGKSNVDDAKKDLKDSQEKYGSVEKETAGGLVAKFNAEVVGNSTLNPASTDYLTEYNNQYWYGLLDGVSLVVVPEKYTGDKTSEIVNYMLLYVNKNGKYLDDAKMYLKYLIKANNNQIIDSEVDELLEEAKLKPNSGETANNGKGISIGFTENNEIYQYQVLRLYK